MGEDACCKVGRAVQQYDLGSPTERSEDMDKYLAARWRGLDGHEEVGLRPLTEWFNKQILRETYYRHGRKVYDTKINAEYQTLVDSEGDRAERAELLVDLESDGIEGEEIVKDFVSKSSLGRHLKNCRGVEKEQTAPDPESNWELERIGISRDKFRENLTKPLRSLENKGRLVGAEEAELTTSIVLSCPHCPTRIRFERAIEQGYICEDHLGRTEPEG